jgi:hypothetical protein
MNPDASNHNFDRAMMAQETLLPSSGFAVSVMEAVRREAATPPAITFPWKRALPGMVGLFACVVWLATTLARAPWAMSAAALSSPVAVVLDAAARYQIGWIALALLVTLVTVKIAFRLAPLSRAN